MFSRQVNLFTVVYASSGIPRNSQRYRALHRGAIAPDGRWAPQIGARLFQLYTYISYPVRYMHTSCTKSRDTGQRTMLAGGAPLPARVAPLPVTGVPSLAGGAPFCRLKGRRHRPEERRYWPQGRRHRPKERLYWPEERRYWPQGRRHRSEGRLHRPQGRRHWPMERPLQVGGAPSPARGAL